MTVRLRCTHRGACGRADHPRSVQLAGRPVAAWRDERPPPVRPGGGRSLCWARVPRRAGTNAQIANAVGGSRILVGHSSREQIRHACADFEHLAGHEIRRGAADLGPDERGEAHGKEPGRRGSFPKASLTLPPLDDVRKRWFGKAGRQALGRGLKPPFSGV
jgi:hypothetical protein